MPNRRWYIRGSCLAYMMVCIGACGDLSPDLPTGIADPNVYTTSEAARQQARYARYVFQLAYPNFVEGTALLTDELVSAHYGTPIGNFDGTISVDSRNMGDVADPASGITLRMFGDVRRYTQQARHALAKYAPNDPPALEGEMFALEGMTEIYMADALCSGIPLSTVDFEQDFTYTSPLSTKQVYEHAIALFDTAIVLGHDSARVHFFARVGKARALMALGRYQEADTVVATIPDGFQYRLPNSSYFPGVPNTFNRDRSTMTTGEGDNGLPFLRLNPAEQDPRIHVSECEFCGPFFRPSYAPVLGEWWTIATAVEARLIRAEAAIHRDDPAWLSFVNGTRTDDSYDVVPGSGSTPDTLWHAGTGGVAGLGPLRDPALDPLPSGKTVQDVRIDLVFRERGFWLYLTGTRQGDFRRLIREYGRPQESVYPSGSYPGGSGRYNKDVNFVIEQDEVYNPHYSKCAGRTA